MQHRKIRTKLRWAFGAMAALIAVVAGLALHAQSAEQRNLERFVKKTSARLLLASAIRDASQARAVAALNIMLARDAREAQSEKVAAEKAHQQVLAAHAKLQELLADASDVEEEERQLYADIKRIEDQYGPAALKIAELASTGRRDEAIASINDNWRPLLAKLDSASEAYADWNAKHAQLIADEAHHATMRACWMLAACSVIGLVLAMFLTASLTRAIEPSLKGMGQEG